MYDRARAERYPTEFPTNSIKPYMLHSACHTSGCDMKSVRVCAIAENDVLSTAYTCDLVDRVIVKNYTMSITYNLLNIVVTVVTSDDTLYITFNISTVVMEDECETNSSCCVAMEYGKHCLVSCVRLCFACLLYTVCKTVWLRNKVSFLLRTSLSMAKEQRSLSTRYNLLNRMESNTVYLYSTCSTVCPRKAMSCLLRTVCSSGCLWKTMYSGSRASHTDSTTTSRPTWMHTMPSSW